VDALLDLLLADGGRTGGIYFHIHESDVRAIMRDPHVGVGSDGLYTGRPGQPARGRPHPRHFGTFPRVLGRYVREEAVLALPEAIRKMTSLSADALGLPDRGRIRGAPRPTWSCSTGRRSRTAPRSMRPMRRPSASPPSSSTG
jgi:N-acyl-D-aspartate/D-glutamate deacylase